MNYCQDCRQLTSGDCGAHGPASEPTYPCADCGVLRTKDQGGTVFTVCDACWEKRNPPAGTAAPFVAEIRAPLEAEIARLREQGLRLAGRCAGLRPHDAEACPCKDGHEWDDPSYSICNRCGESEMPDAGPAEKSCRWCRKVARLTAELVKMRAERDGAMSDASAAELAQQAVEEVQEELAAELAAERQKRAESEAHEGRLRSGLMQEAAWLVRLACGLDAVPPPWVKRAGREEWGRHVEAIRLAGIRLRDFHDKTPRDCAGALRAHVSAAVERVVAAARQARDGVYAPHGTPPGAIMQAVQYASASYVLAAIEAAAKRETT